MKGSTLLMMMAVAVVSVGCASAQPAAPAPVRLDELAALCAQDLDDDALIAEVERRGVVFVLSAKDLEALRAAGISDGVLRYLQGRARGEQEFIASLRGARYQVSGYSGELYLGYPYLGYLDGAHHYGDYRYGYAGLYYSRGGAVHRGGHGLAHHGAHHGGRH